MKKITITNALSSNSKERHSGTKDIFAEGMDIEQDNHNYMDASDGYHTFTELYEHRITLFIALCRFISSVDLAEWGRDNPSIWRSKLHSDGTQYDGWFILGINMKKGEQITYHLPLSKWDETAFANTIEKAPEFDGHTSKDVLKRLSAI